MAATHTAVLAKNGELIVEAKSETLSESRLTVSSARVRLVHRGCCAPSSAELSARQLHERRTEQLIDCERQLDECIRRTLGNRNDESEDVDAFEQAQPLLALAALATSALVAEGPYLAAAARVSDASTARRRTRRSLASAPCRQRSKTR